MVEKRVKGIGARLKINQGSGESLKGKRRERRELGRAKSQKKQGRGERLKGKRGERRELGKLLIVTRPKVKTKRMGRDKGTGG